MIRTHPQAERRALRAIERKGYRGFLPTYVVRRVRPLGGVGYHVLPLFPRYAFVAMPELEPWTPVRYAEGVDRLLMNGDRPALVAEDVVKTLQDGEEVRSREPGAHWRPGDACRIRSGAVAGMDAVIAELAGDDVVVDVMMFGELRRIRIATMSLCERDG